MLLTPLRCFKWHSLSFSTPVVVLFGFFITFPCLGRDSSTIWLSPSQYSVDFQRMFAEPQLWERAARRVDAISFSATYFMRTSTFEIDQALKFARDRGIKVDVSISGLPVDKHICGDGVEGLVWPGEVALYADRLKDLGAQIDSFSFDLPLTSGHLYHGMRACNLPVREVATRVAASIRVLRNAYPSAMMVDSEVPTGISAAEWRDVLTEWIADFRASGDEGFAGMSMDIWWESSWGDRVRETALTLHSAGMRAGIFLDADGHENMTPTTWIGNTKANKCRLDKSGITLDYIVIANWMVKQVKNIPDTDPLSLTSLVNWYVSGEQCVQ